METGLRSILKTDEGRRDREETGRIRESRIQQWAIVSKCLKKSTHKSVQTIPAQRTKQNLLHRQDRQRCQTDSILTLLQRLNLLSLYIPPSLSGPVGYLLPRLPASPLPRCLAHVMSRLRQYHAEYTYSIARWQIVFYLAWAPLWRDKGSEEEGKEDGERQELEGSEGTGRTGEGGSKSVRRRLSASLGEK